MFGLGRKDPSEAQLDFIEQLIEEQQVSDDINLDPETMDEASELIDYLRDCPFKNDGHPNGNNEDADDDGVSLTIHAKLFALDTLVEMLWADRMAQSDNPLKDAKDLKKQMLALVKPGRDAGSKALKREISERLDAVIERVRGL